MGTRSYRGVRSAEAFGKRGHLQRGLEIFPDAVLADEVRFGVPGVVLLDRTIFPATISSQATIPAPLMVPGPGQLHPTAITSAQTLGPSTKVAKDFYALHPQEGPMLNGLRLSLTTGVAVPTADVSGASTLYLTPFFSGLIALYNTTESRWVARSTAQISLALSGLTSGKNYDVFAYWTGSAVALELSAAWTDDTNRATALATQDAVNVKSGDASRRYVGTIRTTGTTTTEDSATKRFVWNGPEPFRQVQRRLTTSATGNKASSAGWGAFPAGAGGKVEAVAGIGDVSAVSLEAAGRCFASTGGNAEHLLGVGVDTTTDNHAISSYARYPQGVSDADGAGRVVTTARYEGQVALGYHAFNWVARGGDGSNSHWEDGSGTLSLHGYVMG